MKRMRMKTGLLVILALLLLVPAAGAIEGLSDINLEWLKSRAEKERFGRNPFAFLSAKKKEAVTLTVSAILYQDGRGSAIINNQILKEGDEIAGRRLVKVLPDRVQLEGADGITELKVERFLLQR